MRFQAPQRPWLPRRPVIVGDHLFERGRGDVHAHVYPATAQVTGEIALAAPQDVHHAVPAARAAFPAWRALPRDQRRHLLLNMAALRRLDHRRVWKECVAPCIFSLYTY